MKNYIYYDVWDGIAYPFPTFNDDDWEWLNNFTPHAMMDVIT